MTILKQLSNQFLIHVYIEAMALKLDSSFISLFEEEIKRRNLSLIRFETGEWTYEI
ncbi:sporulation histidine kinase inhibitor Sda [Bacillus taeanensis]|uniref:Sporulation histidine kinase inhibitor Sda n=1 Tax=Bacillus taeanensis TaxID=273032 RepID=A0A366XQB6_9BACI|nr:sporulation histidine kinase inhibitor Sda [Bacillus taeanensis]RBW67295.1 sporulation histidine kinase inhibitor Sda [Bacillus taeanensis]